MSEENLNQEPQENLEQQADGQEIQSQEPQSQETTSYDFTKLNEQFKDKLGENLLDEGSFTSLIESRGKLSEFEQQLQTKEQELQGAMEYKTKYESFLERFDPEKLTPNKEALALSQLIEKNKDADIGAISKIRESDISSIDPLQGLVLANKLKVKANVPDSVREAEILRVLGIEDKDEMTDAERFRVQTAFANEKKSLEEIRNFQPEGVNFDFEAESKEYQQSLDTKKTELNTHNKEALKILLDTYNETKTTIKDDQGNDIELSYVVDDKFKESFVDTAVKELEASGFKITTENASQVAAQIDQAYKIQNLQNIIQDSVKQMMSRQKEVEHNENHNDSEINRTEAPPVSQKEFKTVREAFRDNLRKRK